MRGGAINTLGKYFRLAAPSICALLANLHAYRWIPCSKESGALRPKKESGRGSHDSQVGDALNLTCRAYEFCPKLSPTASLRAKSSSAPPPSSRSCSKTLSTPAQK